MIQAQIPTASGPLPGYLSVPIAEVSGAGPWPGIVLVHDALGLGDDVRAIADRFATAGYLTVVPDLFGRGGLVRCVRSTFRDLFRGSGRAVDDIDAARAFLASRDDCTGKIGVAGFCLGGGFALLAAARGFDAAAPYYGQLPADTSILAGACPIVASFGKRDPTLKGAAAKLDTILAERGIVHDIEEYPHAGHGFVNRWNLGPLDVLLQVLGFGYHHESAEDSWRRVLTFFADHLN